MIMAVNLNMNFGVFDYKNANQSEVCYVKKAWMTMVVEQAKAMNIVFH